MREIIRQNPISYKNLTEDYINSLNRREAEMLAFNLMAASARIKEGKFLCWSEFNENPRRNVIYLLSQITVSKLSIDMIGRKSAEQIALISTEASGSYFAYGIANELERVFGWEIPIIRARKSLKKTKPSPAMGDIVVYSKVKPITSGCAPKYLVASMSDPKDFCQVDTLFVVDDFEATSSTLSGCIRLGLEFLKKVKVPEQKITIIPVVGLNKPLQLQAENGIKTQARILPVISALAVKFWWDNKLNCALIQANDFDPIPMSNVEVEDFQSNVKTKKI